MSWQHRAKKILFICLAFSGINALSMRMQRGKIKVLLYHNLASDRHTFDNAISPQEFSEHLDYIKTKCNPVGMNADGEWVGLRPDKLNVLVTFDDGFENVFEYAWPILIRHGMTAVFFIIASCLPDGTIPDFAVRYSSTPAKTITTIQMRRMAESGMTFGSHSMSHRDFSKLSDGEAVEDVTKSRRLLAQELGVEVALFAFPWGRYRKSQLSLLRAQVARMFGTQHGFNRVTDVMIRRNEVDNLWQLRAAVSGTLDTIASVLRRSDGVGIE